MRSGLNARTRKFVGTAAKVRWLSEAAGPGSVAEFLARTRIS